MQSRFSRGIGGDDLTALVEFRLAPLAVRRDIAMLGLIHRAAVGEGPGHFKKFFKHSGVPGMHRRQLRHPRSELKRPVVKRSALGLVADYNRLTVSVVEPRCISVFQRNLQDLVLERARGEFPRWASTLSPNGALVEH